LGVILSSFGAIALQQTEPDIRAFLIAEAFRFIDRAKAIPGVKRIALVGSLTKEKADPKDADVLVTVDDAADLSGLAAAARKLKGAAQTRDKGADIFLANPDGRYIGRICHWRECGPGIRTSCDARRCGGRHYLHDDFDDVTLDPVLVKEPPVEVWPKLVCRGGVPADLMTYLSRFQSGISAV
jgi:predicted nucleotidyltransferase